MSIFRDFISLRESPHHLRMLTVFVVSSFIAIFATTLVLGTVLANYMISQMTLREAVVSMQFLNSIVRTEGTSEYFHGEHKNISAPQIKQFYVHVSQLPDVYRANVYAKSGEIIWSSDKEMIGRKFENNAELEMALNGELNPELGIVNKYEKAEHIGLPGGVNQFIEYYIPIWSANRDYVVGAVEVYKAPKDLLASIRKLTTMSWIGAAMAGAVLFSALLLVVGYSSRVLYRQEQRLIEAEKLAVVGEMASAVAHGLRNPLTAIRSCAELMCEDPLPEASRSVLTDIVEQVDRLEGWIRSFLIRNRAENKQGNLSKVDQVVQNCVENFLPQMKKRNIKLEIDAPTSLLTASAPPAEFEQLLNSIVSNAIEAMGSDGILSIHWSLVDSRQILVQIADTGPGIPEESMAQLFEPFHTGKASGLGVGLALGRRMAERLGGQLKLRNRESVGVEVTLHLPSGGHVGG